MQKSPLISAAAAVASMNALADMPQEQPKQKVRIRTYAQLTNDERHYVKKVYKRRIANKAARKAKRITRIHAK